MVHEFGLSGMSGAIHFEKDDGVCTITIQNPGKRNAISYSIMEQLRDTFEEITSDEQYYVVVLRGAGDKAFSAGFDLSQAESRFNPDDSHGGLWNQMIDAIVSYEYPTIAMVNGVTYGGAMEVIAACDLRIGADDTEFGITPAKLGSVYSGRAIQRIMNLIGPAYTKELLYTGEPMYAPRANDIGLLNEMVPRSDLEPETYQLATTITGNAPMSLTYMKEICQTVEEKTNLTDKENRWIRRVRAEAFRSEDHKRAVEAFREGRDPEFTGN